MNDKLCFRTVSTLDVLWRNFNVGMDFTALGKLDTGHFDAVFLNRWFLTHASPHAVGSILQVDQEM
jgi:hypothetical protein